MDSDERERDDSLGGITRREWLLRLGEAAGVFGLVDSLSHEAVATVTGFPACQNQAQAKLPAGLYAPSLDHLTHALIDSERFVAVPAGSPTDFVRRQSGAFRPQFFSAAEYEVLQRLVEIFLDAATSSAPEDLERVRRETRDEIAEWLDLTIYSSADIRRAASQLSPQARTLAVQFYGEGAVHELEITDTQRVWHAGLNWLDETSRERYGKPFLALQEKEQIAILTSISDSGRHRGETAGSHFFALLKSQIGNAYYTSQQGLEEIGLSGILFHANSPGCPKSGHP